MTREGFTDLLDHLRDGDTLTVTSLDRLGRSLTDLMQTVEDLVEVRGVTVRVLNLGDLDTRQPLSRLLLVVLGAVADLERSLIRERTLSGLDAARRRNARLGRPSALTPEQVAAARAMRETGTSAATVRQAFGVSERTVRRLTAN